MRMQNQIGATLRPDVSYHMDKHVQNEIKQVGILHLLQDELYHYRKKMELIMEKQTCRNPRVNCALQHPIENGTVLTVFPPWSIC